MADYEELIGAQFSFGDSLDLALNQFEQFIRALNDKGAKVEVGVSSNALDGIVQQLQEVKSAIGGVSGQFKEAFGTGVTAAAESSKSIKQSVADAESAFVSAQKAQTDAAQAGAAKRIEIAQNEANAIKRSQEELKAKSPVTPEVSRYGSQFLQAELQKIEAERQARLKAPPKEEFPNSQTFGSNVLAQELAKLEKAKADKGISGFFKGVGTGISGGGGSAAEIGEFIGNVVKFAAAWRAVGAAITGVEDVIEAPFEAIKGGVQYLTEFQERASQLKTTLLDHGFFSKDPAENLALAGKAADALQEKVDDLADKLHVKSQTVQAAFETFSGFGGNVLTANLADSVQLAGLATGALQSQNPVIQQRTVATQLQKLTTGTLKDTDKLPAALGISADKLNAMAKAAATTHDLLQQIEADAPGLADRISSANDRFVALVDTTERLGERLEGIAAKPVFDLLTDQLKRLIDWVNRNKDAIQAFAAQLGNAFASVESEFVSLGTDGAPLLVGALKNAIYNASTLLGIVGRIGNALNLISGKKSLSQVQSENQASLNQEADTYDILFKSPQDAKKSRTVRLSQQLTEKYRGSADADAFLREYNAGAAKINADYDSQVNPDAKSSAAINAYHNTTSPATKQTGNTASDQISAIRTSYSEQVAEVKKQSSAIREAIDEDARNFRVSLIDAADLKEAAFQEETEKIVKAGEKAKAALVKVLGGKDPAKTRNAKNAVLKTINENDLGIGLDAANSLTKGQDAVDKQNDAIDAVNRAGDQQRATDLLNADYAYKQELQKKGLITDAQALDNEQTYWDKLYKIRLAGIEKSIEAEKKDSLGDPKKLAELNQQRQTALTEQSVQNEKIQRQRDDLAYNERQRQFGLLEQRDQADVTQAGNQADIDRHAGLTDTARRDNALLSQAQIRLLRTQQDAAVDAQEKAQQDFLKANPNATPEQLAANPAVEAAKNKVSVINAQLIKAEKLDATLSPQGISGQQAADALFGDGTLGKHFHGADDKGLFGDIGQTVDSLGHLAKNIAGSVGAIEQGYQQGGTGGAVGAGLQQVGQFIPGPAGQLVSGIGSIISTVAGLFTQVAQQIGKEVAKAVDQVMEKYGTGQATLNQTLTSVQQQYATLVAKETGRKGGQEVLDTEGVQLQQQIDQLKQQQQQTIESFADSTIVAGGTNSVAQQWLQTWISVNKQVQEYENAVGTSAATQLANQYLNEQLDAQRKSLQDQYNQGQASAVNDALQYNQLLQQRNNYEDQYRQQVFSLQSADSLARRGNPAETTARQISQAKSQYNQETQQLNFQIQTYQQKVAYETQIFGLATDTATLQKQALTDQAYQLNEQVQQYQTIVALLASITGLTAVNGQIPGLSGLGIDLPTSGFGVNDGSLNPIPGFGAPGTTDNSTTTINISIPANILPTTGTPQDFATAIGNQLAYQIRTRGAAAVSTY